jgi:hypothetical protein
VPIIIKRSLTSMQITQFLVGASYAMAHSFVSYTVPVVVSLPLAQSTSQAAAHPTPATLLDNVRDLIFGSSQPAGKQTQQKPLAAASLTEATYAHKTVPCITTTGETFAIWLNVLYLAPLTYLFVKFFIQSYLRRSSAESKRARVESRHRRESNVTLAEKAGWDAAKDLEKEVYGVNGEAIVTRSKTNGRAKR